MTKRYICQFCARSFSRSEHKLRHERSHTKEKPFQCSICKNGFVRRDLLQRHLRTVHGLVLKTSIEGNISINDELLKSPLNNANIPLGISTTTTITGPGSGGSSGGISNSLLLAAAANESLSIPKDNNQLESSPTAVGTSTNSANAANNNSNYNPTPILKSETDTTVSTIDESLILISEKNVISLLTLSNKFNHLKLNLRNSITNYIVIFGTSKKFNDELPTISLNKLLSINENDELLYLIICLGACQMNEFNDAILMFNKSWEIIIEKISNSKLNYNSGEIFNRFVDNLIILSYIYLNYFINFDNSANLESADLYKKISISIDVLFEYLNNIISTHMTNTHGASISSLTSSSIKSTSTSSNKRRKSTTSQEHNNSKNISNSIKHPNGSKDDTKLESFYWYAYLLLSHYSFIYNKSPSSLHLYLLNKVLPDDIDCEDSESRNPGQKPQAGETLGQLISSLSVISTSFQNFVNHDTLTLREKIIICGLMNELQMIKFNETNKLNKNIVLQQGLFKDNKNFLHNAIILANKNFNASEKVAINGNEEFIGLVTLIKRKLLINCPLKFTDLLSNYLILPKSNYNWILLTLTLKEFIFETESLINDKNFLNNDKPIIEFDLTKFVKVNYLDSTSNASPHSTSPSSTTSTTMTSPSKELTNEEIYTNITNYISTPFNSNFIINNNLGITTLPMLLLSLVYIDKNLSNYKNDLNFPINNLIMIEFVVGNFLVLIRILNFYKKKYFIDFSVPMERNWQLNSSSLSENSANSMNSNNQNNNHTNISEDDETADDDDDDDESIILAVIFYVINELGCNYDEASSLKDSQQSKQQNSYMKRRSNSISIGEFSNNNEKLKKMMSPTKDSHHPHYHKNNKNNFTEDSIKSQINNDYKFYFIMKNLEKNFIGWLNLFVNDFQQLKKSINVFELVMNNEIYAKLNLFSNSNSLSYMNPQLQQQPVHSNIDVFNLISPQPSNSYNQFQQHQQPQRQSSSSASQYQQKNNSQSSDVRISSNNSNKNNSKSTFNSNDLFYLQQQHHELYNQQKLPNFTTSSKPSQNNMMDQTISSSTTTINSPQTGSINLTTGGMAMNKDHDLLASFTGTLNSSTSANPITSVNTSNNPNAGGSVNSTSRIMLPPLSNNSRQLPNPFRLNNTGGGGGSGSGAVNSNNSVNSSNVGGGIQGLEGINELLQAAGNSNIEGYDNKK